MLRSTLGRLSCRVGRTSGVTCENQHLNILDHEGEAILGTELRRLEPSWDPDTHGAHTMTGGQTTGPPFSMSLSSLMKPMVWGLPLKVAV